MNVLTADKELLTRLSGIVEPLEIRDASGKVLGHYTPVVSPELAANYARARELFDMEELKRRARDEHGKGYTIEQVMEHLKSLEQRG